MYYIYHKSSGIAYPAKNNTLQGAKRQASADATYDGGDVFVLDKDGHALCVRTLYRNGHANFWWSRWENC